jgi:hypothetical protein
MSQSKHQLTPARAARLASRKTARDSASTADGLVAQRLTLAERDRARHTARARTAARRLGDRSRSDAAAGVPVAV